MAKINTGTMAMRLLAGLPLTVALMFILSLALNHFYGHSFRSVSDNFDSTARALESCF
jgi:hypothetical protein